MIKTINGGGRYVMVNGGMPSTTYVNNSGLGAGNLRYNTSSQNMEVYDGHVWQQLSMSHASVGLTPEAESTLDWATAKMHKEHQLQELAKTNPTIADLLKQRDDIDHKINMVQTLVK